MRMDVALLRFSAKALLFLALVTAPVAIAVLFAPLDLPVFGATAALQVGWRFDWPGPLFPNQHVRRVVVGDLGRCTSFGTLKEHEWCTDRQGFRNRVYTDRPRAVCLGDSFMMGGGLTQAATFPEQLAEATGWPVYSCAYLSLNEYLWRDPFAEPPQYVILALAERTFASASIKPYQRTMTPKRRGPRDMFWGAVAKYTSVEQKMAIDQLLKKWPLASAGWKLFMTRRPPVVDLETGMLFRSDSRPHALEFGEAAEAAARVLAEYSRAVKGSGSTLVVIPIPEKETVYHDWIPERYNHDPTPVRFLETLVPALREAGIVTVDLAHVYRDRRRSDDRLLYQLDDTHWSGHGVRVAVEAFLAEVGGAS